MVSEEILSKMRTVQPRKRSFFGNRRKPEVFSKENAHKHPGFIQRRFIQPAENFRAKYGKHFASASTGIGNFAKSFGQGRISQLKTARDIRRPLIGSGLGHGKRGRPKGSFDPRYAAAGGVYGFRRLLNQQLREQRLQSIKNAQLTPQQQILLRRAEAQRMASETAPENQIIPTTSGKFDLNSLQKEIDDAAHILD